MNDQKKPELTSFGQFAKCRRIMRSPDGASPNKPANQEDLINSQLQEAAQRKPCTPGIALHDYEPEQAWGSQADLRRHIRFGGTLENYSMKARTCLTACL
jgi:hypothetical protein